MPSTGGYLVSPRSIALIAARLTLSGVSKSGSPTDSEMTSRPLALRSRAFCVTVIVAEGFTGERTSARKAMGTESLSEAGGFCGGAPIVRRASNGNPHADAGADRRFGERLIPPMWDIILVQLVKKDAM